MGFYKVIHIRLPHFNIIKNKKGKVKQNATLNLPKFKISISFLHVRKKKKKRKQVSRYLKETKFKKFGIGGILLLLLLLCFFPMGGKFLLKEVFPFFHEGKEDMTVENNGEFEFVPIPEPFVFNQETLSEINSFADLQKYVFTIDATAFAKEEDFDLEYMKTANLKTDLKGEKPKILIFHTHSQETFSDSRPGRKEDSIYGVGETLKNILSKKYGVSVLHDEGVYDMENGKLSRGNSYERMEPHILKILEQNPSIEICIDLHRDGVPETTRLLTNINGKQVAKIMFFNGICRLNDNGTPKELPDLPNPYIKENTAFSFRMQAMCNSMFPGWTRKVYVKPYRYSLHMRPMSLLIEAGANTNTVAEVKNAMEPLAAVLVKVLKEGN